MIIEPSEIDELVRRLEAHMRAELSAEEDPNNSYPATEHLYRNPHLLLAAGYDEYRLIKKSDKDAKEIPELFYRLKGGAAFPLGYEAILRKVESGSWHLFQGLRLPHKEDEIKKRDGSLRVLFDEGWELREFSTNDLIQRLETIAKTPIERTSVLSFSSLWAPSKVRHDELQIVDATKQIIESVRLGRESLQQVGWRELEEVVAEILRSSGMQISVTPRSHDGGRDIIARGELFGEPLTFAVEVKQKNVVPISDARSALYANRHIPALMLVTSGVFSAGVISEKKKEENRLRLILKDGLALNQWIQTYRPR